MRRAAVQCANFKRRRQFRPKIGQQRFKLRLIEHRRLNQQGAGAVRDERLVGLDLPLNLVCRANWRLT